MFRGQHVRDFRHAIRKREAIVGDALARQTKRGFAGAQTAATGGQHLAAIAVAVAHIVVIGHAVVARAVAGHLVLGIAICIALAVALAIAAIVLKAQVVVVADGTRAEIAPGIVIQLRVIGRGQAAFVVQFGRFELGVAGAFALARVGRRWRNMLVGVNGGHAHLGLKIGNGLVAI